MMKGRARGEKASAEVKGEAVKVAVIGSGLSGLSAAYLLCKDQDAAFEVHLYEKAASLGYSSFIDIFLTTSFFLYLHRIYIKPV